MKKIIALSFVLAAMIFIGMYSNSSANIRSTSNGTAQIDIEYQVIVHPNWAILHNQCPIFVSLTSGLGTGYIGQPQLYQQGINTYYFSEPGPVTGVRIAHLILGNNGKQDDVCLNVSMSNSKTGIFYGGHKYVFDLREIEPALNNVSL